MNLIHDPYERVKFIRFAIVGTIGSVVDFGVFNLLATLLKTPAVAASMVSFTLAVINNFFWNRYWTYPETRTCHCPNNSRNLRLSVSRVLRSAPHYSQSSKNP